MDRTIDRTRFFTICFLLVATVANVAVDSAAAADEQEGPLIAVLQSEDATRAEKAITCKQLAVHGTKNAVPALAALLPDKELTSWARTALEVISGPEADVALRDALGELEGRVLIGVINSIAVRRDTGAVGGLAERLKDTDADVASAAAVALGRIGNDLATKILEKSLADAPGAVRSAVAEGCILCAERLLADGKSTEAASLFDKVRAADVPKQRVIEATRGAILARGSDGTPLLIEQLRADDKGLLAVGLAVARELPGRDVTESLVAELEKIAPSRRALLLWALADRGDPAMLPAVLETAASGPSQVRIVAVDVLRRVGDVSSVPVLLDVAMEADAELAAAAVAAIKDLPGEGVDAELVARLSQAKDATRPLLIELVGQRRITAATTTLLEAADDSDAEIRAAALTALGSTVGLDDLSVLIARVVSPRPNATDTEVAEQALRTACIRMPEGEACAKQLVDALPQASVSAKCTVLEILGAMGNATALEAIGVAAKDESPELQDTASRLLGEWMTLDAAPVLLDLAKSAPGEKYQIRALRGYIRLVRQFTVPDPQRVTMCRVAMETAGRDAEKKLVLEVVERYPSLGMLEFAIEATKIPSLNADATKAALTIAQKLGGKSVDARKLLDQIGVGPMKIEIVKAEYGADTKSKDVTAILKKHVRRFPLIVLPSSSYNSAFGGDPAQGIVKQLKVQYRIDGKAAEVTLPENAPIMLPVPK